jgi:hypothetical protein
MTSMTRSDSFVSDGRIENPLVARVSRGIAVAPELFV